MTISRYKFHKIAAMPAMKRDAPFSLTLSFEEKAALYDAAGGVPLGAYIKAELFNGAPHNLKRKDPRVSDDKALGRVLGALGKSRLSNNVNQLAKAVNIGTLPVTSETESQIKQACADVATMREELLRALKPGGRS